jgi:hypothetical protein
MPESTDTLQEEASRVLPEIRNSFAGVLASLPSHIRRPRDITRVMGVNQTLAWKIMQVVKGKDPFAAAQYIPGTEGVNIFLDAARRLKAPEEVIARARAAMKDFRRLIADHAGDRASLELMLGASATEGSRQTDLTYRKAGFQCASYTWGIQARARLMTMMLYPHSDPLLIRCAKIAGFVGLRRVRPQIRWPLAQPMYGDYEKGSNVPLERPFLPIDPDGALPGGVPLLRQFSSVLPDAIKRIALPNGQLEDCWVGSPVGDKAAINCFTGEVVRKPSPRYADEQNLYIEFGTRIRTPMEVLVRDLFVHGDLYGRIEPVSTVYSELSVQPWFETPQAERREQDVLPFSETVEYLGEGPTVIHTPDVPRYEEMMRFAFSKLEWDIQACDVYRVRVAYPVIATALTVRFKMPPAPSSE